MSFTFNCLCYRITAVLVSRFLLHLQSVHREGVGAPGDTQAHFGSAGSVAFARVVGSLGESLDPYARSHEDYASETHELGDATEVGSGCSSKSDVHPDPDCPYSLTVHTRGKVDDIEEITVL